MKYRVFIKYCVFFTIHCIPSLAYIAVKDLQSSQRNESVQSLLLAGNFCTTNSSRVTASERWQTFENSWKKTQYLMNTLYHSWFPNDTTLGSNKGLC